MNGVHDMGGMHGMGPVVREENEPVFHHEWERRTFALGLAAGRLRRWNLDMFRYARELMPPAEYLAASYYERGLHALERLLVERGILTREEIARRMRERRGAPAWRARLARLGVRGRLLAGRVLGAPGGEATGGIPARFKPGDPVVARNLNPRGHTRLPRYVRGRRGVIDRDHGVFVFPDTHAMERVRQPQHCYSVRFTARELWGADASARDAVYVDLFDGYLDPA